MRLLLDTHALIWWWIDSRKLPQSTRKLIADARNEILVSAASAWEIATKQRLDKLGLPEHTLQSYDTLLAADGFTPISITTTHALRAGAYPQPHRDPFDRMLAAQSELEKVALISRDPAMSQFGIEVIW